jgi:UDP-2,3-diacylglucosamine pyrophosphatase LpxH
MAPPSVFDESLLILSDVHLGSDLNDLAPGPEGRRSARVDADLANLLEHYRRAPSPGRRWRLVIAGDFIDFIGIAILPRSDLGAAFSAEELEHGLGNAADRSRMKLRAVAARHATVLEALARFVGDGHALTIVHGNHDVEFHWDAVKDELRSVLATLAAREGAIEDGAAEAAYKARIDFAQWFYYVGGVAYVEHGHQYDMLCATENVMAPLSPADPARISRSFSDVLLRWVVRPTRGMKDYGHDRMGLADYVLFAARLGVVGLVRLGWRFASAVHQLFVLRRESLSSAARALREEHERRMAVLAEATRVGIERLRALAALQVPPVTRSVERILASVLLDRLAVALGGVLAIAALIPFAAARQIWAWPALGAVVAAWILAHRRLVARRRSWFGEKLDPDEVLVDRAGHLARLFPAAFVVMGHTHSPAMVPVAQGTATYVNVGSWHEGEPGEGDDAAGAYRAARTHLVIHPAPSGPDARFLAWGPTGPEEFVRSPKA